MCAHRWTTLARASLSLFALLAISDIAYSAQPRPLVLEDVAKLTLPDPSWSCCGGVAISGNIILVTASRAGVPPNDPFSIDQAAFVFERNAAGQWQYVTKLVEDNQDPVAHVTDISVAVEGSIAAVALGQIYFFQRTSSGWVPLPSNAVAGNSTDIEASQGRFVVSEGGCGYDAHLVQNVSGTYSLVQYFTGFDRGECDDEFVGGDVDISANRVVVGGPEVYLFTNTSGTTWTRQLIPAPVVSFEFGLNVALFNGTLLASASPAAGGPYVFLPPYQQSSGNLIRPDALNVGRFGTIDLSSGLAAVGNYDDPSRNPFAGSVAVFSTSDNRNFTYAARLVTREALSSTLGLDVGISNRTVVAGANGAIHVFQLPTDLSQPTVRQDDFEDGNASDWTPIAGSSFTVVSNGSTFVYRQSSLAGAAGSSPTGMDWKNQSIQADIKPTAFDGADRWFGLTLRQTDTGNYYYVTMRSTNTVQIKKLVNGASTTLASVNFPVTLRRTYNLRLEAIGTWLRAFVDGNQVLQVRDTSQKNGRAGIYTYKTRADFDNVIVTPSPQTTLFQDDFDSRGIVNPFWQLQTGTWNLASDTSTVLAQTSIDGGSRAVVGVPTEDQILQVRARPTSFTTTGERWFGVVARFVDDQNYYYVTARNNNTISLRKLVNGATTVLDSAPLQVTAGTWYKLRLEAVGSSLRLYVNDRLTLEAADSSHTKGIYGLAAFKTAVRYDDVNVREP